MMFSSKYESVRKIRESSARRMERLFMESLVLLDRNRVLLKTLDSRRIQSVSSIDGQEGSFHQTVSWRALCYGYVNVVSEEIRCLEKEIEGIEEEVSRRRFQWQEALKELKKIEHLMEVEFQGQRQLAERREERSQDDLQMSRWGRNGRPSPSSPEKGEERR